MRNLKIIFTSVLLFVLVLKCALASPPTALKFAAVEAELMRLHRDTKPTRDFRGNDAKFAAIKITDEKRNQMYLQSEKFHRIAGIVTEVCLLEEAESKFKGNSGYLYLVTHNTPCDDCIKILNQYAEDNPDMRFYVGYTKTFGTGHRQVENTIKKTKFETLTSGSVPANLRYVYMGKPPVWVTEP